MASRDPWLDNAKMALVTLVVVGHGWALLPDQALPDQLYVFLYLWHMPAFVFVTGYLSRGFTYSRRRLFALVTTLAVPYLLFETLMAVFRYRVGGEPLEDLYVVPHWPFWYLVALIAWRLLTPVLRPLPGAVPLAVLVSVTSGLWATDHFGLYRVMGFLPFFVLGLKATPERLEVLRRAPVRRLAVVVLALALLASRFVDSLAAKEWVYYNVSFADLGATDERGMLNRLVFLAVGLICALGFLALVPRRDGWFARMGSASLVVYLGHGFVVRGAEFAGFPEWSAQHLLTAMLLVVVVGTGVALALASPPVRAVLGLVVDPFGHARGRVQDAVDLMLHPTDAERVATAAAPLRRDLVDASSR